MLGISFDALKHRDAHRRIRRLQTTFTILIFVMGLLAGMSWYANQKRILAVERTSHLRTILSGFIWKLCDDIDNLPGSLNFKGELLEGSLDYIDQLASEENDDKGLERELEVTYSKIGEVLLLKGKLTDARVSFEKSLAYSQRLSKNDKTNALYQIDLAQNLNGIGNTYLYQGKLDEANGEFKKELDILNKINNVSNEFEPIRWAQAKNES